MASQDKVDLLAILKAELGFLDDGGYGRSVRTPWRPTSLFLDSPICLNFGDPQRTQPCTGCPLMGLVPAGHRSSSVPCHYIPLTTAGDTVCSLEGWANQQEREEVLRKWLRSTIERLERSRPEGSVARVQQ